MTFAVMQKGKLMSDLVSTQESVTKIVDAAIRKILSGEQKLTKEYEQSVKDAVDVILDTARREAQADIVRCKDCKYGEQDEVGRWFCRGLGCQIGNEDGSGFCADAERRSDG